MPLIKEKENRIIGMEATVAADYNNGSPIVIGEKSRHQQAEKWQG